MRNRLITERFTDLCAAYRSISSAVLLTDCTNCSNACNIGPILFIVFKNDLAEAPQKHRVIVKLYADDAKIYMHVSSDGDIAKLQCALDALIDWEKVWQLTVSVKK